MKKIIVSGFVFTTLLGTTPQISILTKASTINSPSKKNNYLQ